MSEALAPWLILFKIKLAFSSIFGTVLHILNLQKHWQNPHILPKNKHIDDFHHL